MLLSTYQPRRLDLCGKNGIKFLENLGLGGGRREVGREWWVNEFVRSCALALLTINGAKAQLQTSYQY